MKFPFKSFFKPPTPEEECLRLANEMLEILHKAGYEIGSAGLLRFGVNVIDGRMAINGPYGTNWKIKGRLTAGVD